MSTAREIELQRLLVRLVGDLSGYKKMMNDAVKLTGQKTREIGEKAKAMGKSLTTKVTVPVTAAAGVATKMATDLNRSMAEVQSLGLDQTRTGELKKDVQEIATLVGKNTNDISAGLYQTVSAFGDAADSADKLKINAKAAVAGVASTADAINLTSAVTKAYGDTSANAVQDVADLAFQTVKLGQTTFPELASSIGKVTPLAKALGVEQEELFAGFATLTGVTGNTAEVATQLRATYQALLKPTTEMGEELGNVAYQLDQQGKLIENQFTKKWKNARKELSNALDELDKLKKNKAGADEIRLAKDNVKDWVKDVKESAKSLGQTIVQSIGFTDALKKISDQAEGDTNKLGKMFGSVEAINAVLALGGSQADVYREKLKAMGDASGAAEQAFRDQTEGINAAGFAMDRMGAKTQVILQKIGDRLIPIFNKLVMKLESVIEWWDSLSESTQDNIVKFGLLAAALGPVLLVLGQIAVVLPTVASGMATLYGWMAVIGTPIAAAAAGVTAFNAGIAALGVGAAGVVILIRDLYNAVKDLNKELEKSGQLNDKLNVTRINEVADTIKRADAAPEGKKIGILNAKLIQIQKDLARNKSQLEKAEAKAESFALGGVFSPLESKIAEQELKEIQDRIRATKGREQVLKDKIQEVQDNRDPDAKKNAKNHERTAKALETIANKKPKKVIVQGAVR